MYAGHMLQLLLRPFRKQKQIFEFEGWFLVYLHIVIPDHLVITSQYSGCAASNFDWRKCQTQNALLRAQADGIKYMYN